MTLIPRPTRSSPETKLLEAQLSEPILMSERVRKSATESIFFRHECDEVVEHVDHISKMLRTVVRFSTTTKSVYDRPILQIADEVSRTLRRTYTLVRKCRLRSFLYRLVHLVTAADFHKLLFLLEASDTNLRWLISILHVETENNYFDLVLSIPPIANNDPILAWVWSYVATVQMNTSLSARVEAVNEITALGKDDDRNKKVIVEEGGVPPLLKLLKEGSSIEGQIAAVMALYEIADDMERVQVIADNMGVPLIVDVLGESPVRVQIKVSDLVARMAEFDHKGFIKEEFGKENVICPLVMCLSFETFLDEFKSSVETKQKLYLEWRKENSKPKLNATTSFLSYFDVGSPKAGHLRKERGKESPEVKKDLKINCARALWMLAKDSVANSRRICETKALLCLAKFIQNERGVLQKHSVMAIMEITAAAEVNSELRKSVFKSTSPVAKAVLDQLLMMIKESDDQNMIIAAIRSIGSLSRTFPAKVTHVIGTLVHQLGNNDYGVVTEAVIALGKFAEPDNFLCHEHSKTIIEFQVVIPLLRLLRANQKVQIHGLFLLCYLSINASKHEALENARVLAALKGVEQKLIAQHPELKELVTKAVYHLDLYHGEIRPYRQSSLTFFKIV